MKRRYLLVGLTALGASITMVAQQGAPNEGRTLQGPALRIERNVEYARVGAQALLTRYPECSFESALMFA